MNVFNRLDDYLIAKAQIFADWLQQTCGLSCFGLARVLFVVCTCADVGLLLARPTDKTAAAFVTFALRLLIFAYAEISIARITANTGNPLAHSFSLYRIFLLLVLPLLITRPIFFTNSGYLTALYLYSCTPAPPGVSRLRQWLQSFGGGGRTAPCGNR